MAVICFMAGLRMRVIEAEFRGKVRFPRAGWDNARTRHAPVAPST
jgi:hypothetical protein